MPLTILPVPLPLVYGTDGPAIDISAFNDEKTILVAGSFGGQFIMLASHDGIKFAPVFSFGGIGVLSIKQIFKQWGRIRMELPSRQTAPMPSSRILAATP